MVRSRAPWLASIALGVAACTAPRDQGAPKSDSAEVEARVERISRALEKPASSKGWDAPVARWVLPRELREVSGLALTSDGRLLAHNDDDGGVTVIDPRRGVLLKRFYIGRPAVRADFEGITVAGHSIYELASNGVLYQFDEGENGEGVPYAIHDTRLGKECEFEGVAYDSTINSLLLACKRVFRGAPDGSLVIYRWKLGQDPSTHLSMLVVPFSRAIGTNAWTTLHPSDITVDPESGNYVLIAAREQALIEITPSGEVVRSVPLPSGHKQAEGVAITRDGLLLLSDEARNSLASVTLYRWPSPGAPP